jgi:hypothetical protein
MPSGPEIEYVTKLSAARRQLVTALRLFFDDREPVSVHTLAHAAWEITSSLCKNEGIKTFIENAAEANDASVKDIKAAANQFKNFFKHADRDPEMAIDDFGDKCNDHVLIAATLDLGMLCEGKLPVEVRTFQLWYFAINPDSLKALREEPYEEAIRKRFPDIQKMDRAEQKRIGKDKMLEHLADPAVLKDQNTDRSQLEYWK